MALSKDLIKEFFNISNSSSRVSYIIRENKDLPF